MTAPVLIMTRKNIAALMRPADYLGAMNAGFRAFKEGRAQSPLPMHIDGVGGAFHAKGAAMRNGDAYVALKFNGNFPDNPARFGLPTIQGAVFLCNAENGKLLAVLDSIEITLRRTAAASALAAQHLAREDASTLCVCGCGEQGRVQAEALAQVRAFRRGYAWDINPSKAEKFAMEMTEALGFGFTATRDLQKASRGSDVIVTCTTAKSPFLSRSDVSPGAFIAAVGADNPDKQEIEPALVARSLLVVDDVDQCAKSGDLHHALAAGVVDRSHVAGTLRDLARDPDRFAWQPGRTTLFDSTGIPIEDVAGAVRAVTRARSRGLGRALSLA